MPSNTFLTETETASCRDIPDIIQGVQKRGTQRKAIGYVELVRNIISGLNMC